MAEKADLQSDEAKADETNADEAEKISKQATTYCDPCLEEEVNTIAEGFCVDCNDYLCVACYSIHRKPKVWRNHVLQGKTEMPCSKPTKMNELKKCVEHKDETMELYCHCHDQVFCKLCRSIDHRNCAKIEAIDIVCQNSTKFEEVQKMSEELEQLLTEFEANMNHIRENKIGIESYHQAVIKSMRVIRDKDLQMMAAIETTCHTVSPQITTLRNDLDATRNDKSLSLLMMMASKSQVKLLKERLLSIKSDNTISKYGFVPSIDVSSGHLGMLKKCPFKLEDIRVNTSSDQDLCYITGIERLSEHLLILADHANSKIKLLDMTRKTVVSELKLDMKIWDLAKINDKRIAVTALNIKTILIVSMSDKLSVLKSITVDESSECNGIVCFNNTLIVSYNSPHQIHILDLDGAVKQSIKHDGRFSALYYIAIRPDTETLYLPDCTNHKVLSMTMDGKILSSFTHEHLKDPRGITVGRDGRIFVCCDDSNNVLEISSDLATGQVIFDNKNISKPESIFYNEEEHKLFVGSYDKNTIQVFLV